MFKKLVIALLVVGVLVIGIAGFSGSAAQASHNCSSDSAVLAANPELAVACRYHDAAAVTEIAVPRAIEASAARYTGMAEYYAAAKGTTNSAFLAANPELLKAYTPNVAEGVSESTLLANNPELLLARRHTLPENEVNPDRDIGLLEFFTMPNETGGQRAVERKADDDIGLLEFFTGGSRPVTYDVEALRDYFAQEWTIEADTTDPGLLMQPVHDDFEMTVANFLAANPELMIVRRYTGAIENESSQPDPYKRTAAELARHQNYIALHVRQADLEHDAVPGANPVLSVAQCTAIMEQWTRLHHPGR